MIIDGLYELDPAGTSLAIAVGTQASTNIIDLHGAGLIPILASGQGARDMGIGDDPALKVSAIVTTTFTSGGAATLACAFQGAPDNGSGSPSTWSTYATTSAYAYTVLAAGIRMFDIDWPRPPAGVAFPRFIRLLWTVAGATITAGAVRSDIVLDRSDLPRGPTGLLSGYPAGITINN